MPADGAGGFERDPGCVQADPQWSGWSAKQLDHWLDQGPVVINAIVYGEIAFATDRIEVVDEFLPAHLYDYRPLPREAAFPGLRLILP